MFRECWGGVSQYDAMLEIVKDVVPLIVLELFEIIGKADNPFGVSFFAWMHVLGALVYIFFMM